MRDAVEVKKEIDAIARYLKDGVYLPNISDIVYLVINQWWDRKKIFLQDGDALVYPYPRLEQILRYLNEKLPFIERIGAYATAQDILRRSLDELKNLRDMNLKILYMGIESGNDQILEKICKGVTADQLVEAGSKVREAGITLSCTVILGLGSKEDSEQHIAATASVLNRIDPEFAAALTLTMVPGTPLYQDWEQGAFTLISPLESLEELLSLVKLSNFTDCFFSSMHASNYFSIRGKLPQQKNKMIQELEYVITRKDTSLLRPEYLRGL